MTSKELLTRRNTLFNKPSNDTYEKSERFISQNKGWPSWFNPINLSNINVAIDPSEIDAIEASFQGWQR